jgi:OTU domain-containing protein 6
MARKLKKGGSRLPTPPPPIADDDQEDLMNDLLSQLEARDSEPTVQKEAAQVLTEMDLNSQAEQLESGSKTSAKDRFKARQVRIPILAVPYYPLTIVC